MNPLNRLVAALALFYLIVGIPAVLIGGITPNRIDSFYWAATALIVCFSRTFDKERNQ